MQLLYHYTSIETIFSILEKFKENKEDKDFLIFWATHSFYMNDPWEYKLYAEYLKDKVIEYAKKTHGGVKEEYLEKSFGEQNLHLLAPYIISFSTEKDNLNMWRAYGKNGKGVCLEFDFDDIEQEIINFSNTSCPDNYLTYKDISKLEHNDVKVCKYKSNKDELFDDDFIKEVYKNICDSDDVLSQCINDRKIYLSAPTYKHSSYKDESEFRIVKSTSLGREKFRISDNGLLIPYIEVRIPIKCLKKIIVMPSSELKLQIESLKRYLCNGAFSEYKIQVETSQISYRPNI